MAQPTLHYPNIAAEWLRAGLKKPNNVIAVQVANHKRSSVYRGKYPNALVERSPKPIPHPTTHMDRSSQILDARIRPHRITDLGCIPTARGAVKRYIDKTREKSTVTYTKGCQHRQDKNKNKNKIQDKTRQRFLTTNSASRPGSATPPLPLNGTAQPCSSNIPPWHGQRDPWTCAGLGYAAYICTHKNEADGQGGAAAPRTSSSGATYTLYTSRLQQ